MLLPALVDLPDHKLPHSIGGVILSVGIGVVAEDEGDFLVFVGTLFVEGFNEDVGGFVFEVFDG